MSYCRFSEDSDVYMFLSVHNVIECCMCSLNAIPSFSNESCKCGGEGCYKEFKKYSDAIKHLNKHIDNGDRVPNRVFEILEKEKKMYFNNVRFAGIICSSMFIYNIYTKIWKILFTNNYIIS